MTLGERISIDEKHAISPVSPPRGENAYTTVARELKATILKHGFGKDGRLPTEAELVETYKMSRQTIRRAMQDLVNEGLVYRVAGRGTFVTRRSGGGEYLWHFGSIGDLMMLSQDTSIEMVTPLNRRVDTAAAGRLRLDSDAVVTLSFIRLNAGIPFCWTDIYLPPAIGSQLFDVEDITEAGRPSTKTILGLIDSKCNIRVAEAEQSITVAHLPATAAAALGVEPGKAVMQADRVYFDASDQPVELAISYILPELYSYRIRLRRSV